MKFIDDVKIQVVAGKGGDGCMSFLREKFVPRGGPNGGDGGDGANVYLVGDSALNTLVDFRYKRLFKAPNGQPGQGKERTGKKAVDLEIRVPLGTVVYELPTGDVLGELIADSERLLVAKGGFHGLGNARFKSSTNRAPRKTTPGKPGEDRELRLELKLLADVGLLGLPNAGKSTLIRAISAARPEVADYPFTTKHPNLGVVSIDTDRSFVVADVPGVIEGGADGAGLGLAFLKHLSRTRLLLHLVDAAPVTGNPADDARVIVNELEKYGDDLADRPRWLIINKVDLLPEEDRRQVRQEIVESLKWSGPVMELSGATGEGCQRLCQQIMQFLEELPTSENE